MANENKLPDGFSAYEDGKHRRYSLLFAVNGGAFALAQVMVNQDTVSASLGGLKLSYLGYGMALFTVVMSADIFMFGEKMRKSYVPDAFAWQGKLVLALIGALICAGWLLVSLS